ncbi:MAG: saccharopine dehydrogenase NADP-binding domain-containing protein [Pseudomonadota bacterium]
MTTRSYDLVLFGATGFTGGLTAEYLARNAPAKTRWAIAGRSRAKLEAVRDHLANLNPACAALPLLVSDADDAVALAEIARSTKVIVTTIGPYLKYGEPLVRACAEAGTHYCDLTGEPEFVDSMWLQYHETAKRTGAKLVHCCGFDSIPHDLGAYFTVLQLPGDNAIRVQGFVNAGGQFSGGTLHSAINQFSRLAQYAKVKSARRKRDEWALDRKIGGMAVGVRFMKELGTWTAPMPTIDPQVVLRSAAALERYGPAFRYGHFVQLKTLGAVAKLGAGVGAALVGSQIKPLREKLLALKQPGDGPSAERRAKSWFKVTFIGESAGHRVVTSVSGGDPGYGETSKMLAESGLCLAFDKLPAKAGQLTTAVAMGDALIKRLQKAGIVFKVEQSA